MRDARWGGGAECAVGSCACSVDDPAEGIDIRSAGAGEGADLDEVVSPVSVFEEEAILGQSFLGHRLLCGHCGVRCGHDTPVCPLPGEEGKAVRATATVRLGIITARHNLQGPPPLWGDFPKPHPSGADSLLNKKKEDLDANLSPRFDGAPGKIRTCDFQLRRLTLYPLSYGRKKVDHMINRVLKNRA